MNKDKIFDHMYDGYQALAFAILGEKDDKVAEDSYEMGYLDAYADAVQELGWAIDGEPLKPKRRFELFGSIVKHAQPMRTKARKILKEDK